MYTVWHGMAIVNTIMNNIVYVCDSGMINYIPPKKHLLFGFEPLARLPPLDPPGVSPRLHSRLCVAGTRRRETGVLQFAFQTAAVVILYVPVPFFVCFVFLTEFTEFTVCCVKQLLFGL